ncbi:MAG: hypothetical protein HQ446_01290 [Polaromonas sp.]|nr:hypothetical protein [Polaromonas sp.]
MRDDLIFDTHYGYWFNLACERYYKHIDVAVNFVQLVGGSSAAFAAVTDQSFAVVASGLALAACAAISLTVQPGIKAEQHLQAKCRYLDIKGRLLALSDEALNAEVVDAQRTGPAGIGALATPAFNSTLHAIGRTDGFRPLSRFERMASCVA